MQPKQKKGTEDENIDFLSAAKLTEKDENKSKKRETNRRKEADRNRLG